MNRAIVWGVILWRFRLRWWLAVWRPLRWAKWFGIPMDRRGFRFPRPVTASTSISSPGPSVLRVGSLAPIHEPVRQQHVQHELVRTTAGGSWRRVNIGNFSNEVSDLGLGFTISSNPDSGPVGTARFNSSGGSSWADGFLGDFELNSLNYFGFRFQYLGATHYGFGVMRLGASITDRYMMGFAFESSAGAAILTDAIPAPGAVALLGLAGLAGSRRRRG